MFRSPYLQEILRRLRALEQPVTLWEADFLARLLRQRRALSAKQYAIVIRMAEQYLPETMAAELHGQQRLLETSTKEPL